MKYRCSSCGTIYEGELPNCPNCGKAMKYAPKEIKANAIPIVEEEVIKYEPRKFGGKQIAYNILYLLMCWAGIATTCFIFFAPLFLKSYGLPHSIFTFVVEVFQTLFTDISSLGGELYFIIPALCILAALTISLVFEFVYSVLGFIKVIVSFFRKEMFYAYDPSVKVRGARDPHNILAMLITDFFSFIIIRILFFLWGNILLGNFARLFWPLWIAYGVMIFNYMALVIAKTIVKSTIHE